MNTYNAELIAANYRSTEPFWHTLGLVERHLDQIVR